MGHFVTTDKLQNPAKYSITALLPIPEPMPALRVLEIPTPLQLVSIICHLQQIAGPTPRLLWVFLQAFVEGNQNPRNIVV